MYKYERLPAIMISVILWLAIPGYMMILMFAVPEGDSGDTGIAMTALALNISATLTTLQKIVISILIPV